jgi:transcriptional regulator with XRE-family HTH domain
MKIETDCYSAFCHAQSMTEKEAVLIEFSQRFRQLMIEQGWSKHTREDVGKRLGVTGPAVTYWWNGDRLPTMQQAITMSMVFNCCVEWVLTGRGSMRPLPSEEDLIDVSLLPEKEKANYKALIDTRTQQIITEKKANYALAYNLEQN